MPSVHLIKPSVERITEPDPYKRIELAGRVCYKSESKIQDGTAEAFVNMVVKRGHTSVLEHANLVMKLDEPQRQLLSGAIALAKQWYRRKPHITTEYIGGMETIASGNLRAWYELIKVHDCPITVKAIPLLDIQHDDEPVRIDLSCHIISEESLAKSKTLKRYHSRVTMRIVCDRGVSHELVRHRVMSFSQESTRYVNYKKTGMQFITPWWYDDCEDERALEFVNACNSAMRSYNSLMEQGATPEMARAVLPNSIKTEMVITSTPDEWWNMLQLRKAKNAHPDMRVVAGLIEEKLMECL